MQEREYRLYKGCKKYDKSIQKEVFEGFLASFLAIAERYSLSQDEAEDVVQESFISIFNKIETFHWQGEGSFIQWMKRITTNAAINVYQKQKSKKMVSLEEANFLVDDCFYDIDTDEISQLKPEHLSSVDIREDDLLQCVHALPEHFKIVFNMHVIDEYSHKEIAQELGISEKTSTTRLFRARKLIQNELAVIMKKRMVVYE